MPFVSSAEGTYGYGRPRRPVQAAAPVVTGGSILFDGTTNGNLSIANDVDFRNGTGDFTIEWYQYQIDSHLFPRIFQIGTYPTTSIGVSIEGGAFYYWSR